MRKIILAGLLTLLCLGTAKAQLDYQKYTENTITRCNNGVCNAQIFSDIKYVNEKSKWIKISESQESLLPYFKIEKLSIDSDYNITINEITYDNINFTLKVTDRLTNSVVPLSYKYCKITDERGVCIEDEIVSVSIPFPSNIRTFNIPFLRAINIRPYDVLWKFGDNSTTIKISDNVTGNIMDTFVEKNSPTTNFGTSEGLSTRTSTSSCERIYIRFNISTVPAGVSIVKANLSLYMYSPSSSNWIRINVTNNYDNLNNTNETTMHWNNQPCGVNFNNSTYCNLTNESWVPISNTINWYTWNISDILNYSYNLGIPNATMVLKTNETGASVYSKVFVSRNNISAPNNRPYINISYNTASVGTCWTENDAEQWIYVPDGCTYYQEGSGYI